MVEGAHVGSGSNVAPSTILRMVPSPFREEQEDLAALATRAARLCKADLVTQMVGEFPELQGLIGGHLARAQGEDPAVADAIRDHYKPVGQGDEIPTAPVTVAVSLADKLDSLAQFFGIWEKPTGSKDPFALRRAAIGAIQLIVENGLRPSLISLFDQAQTNSSLGYKQNPEPKRSGSVGAHDLLDFFADRLKVQQREAGVRHDLIDAVFALGGEDDLVRLLARVKALQAFVETPEGADLLAGYKRAANILKKEGYAVIPAKAGTRTRAPDQGGFGDASALGPGCAGMTTQTGPEQTAFLHARNRGDCTDRGPRFGGAPRPCRGRGRGFRRRYGGSGQPARTRGLVFRQGDCQ